MAHSIPNALIAEKNALWSGNSWAWLFDVFVAKGHTVLYLTNHDAAITFDANQDSTGEVYQPYPIQFEEIEETSKGDLPMVVVTVGNASREMTAFLERYNGMRDERVNLHLVNLANLADNTAKITQRFKIRSATANADAVTFELSSHPFFDIDFPFRRFLRDRCGFRFRSEECGWAFPTLPVSVPDSFSCSKSLDGINGCREHGDLYEDNGEIRKHPERFGGFPGIPKRRAPS